MEDEPKTDTIDKTIDSALETLLTKSKSLLSDKTKRTVLMVAIFGFVLRLLAARNLGVSADDVNHAVRPIGILGSGKLAIWDQSTALWYYIQGVFYNIFGYSTIASRFAAALFGTLMIILMFLFVKRVFKSEKSALIASFLVALSPMMIKLTMPEMDIAIAFFALFSAYFLFGYFDSKSKKDLIFAGLFMGIAIMIKVYAIFFAFSFFIFLIYKLWIADKGKFSKVMKRALLFFIVVFIMFTPSLAHNYLLYQDKGFMDLMYTNQFKLGTEEAEQYYGWGAGWMPYTDFKGFFLGNQQNYAGMEGLWYKMPGLIIMSGTLLSGDPILYIFGVLGLIFLLLFKRKEQYLMFFIILLIPAFIVLGAHIPMSKHFVWILVFLTPLSANLIATIQPRIKKLKLKHILVILILFNLLWLGMPQKIDRAPVYGQYSFNQLVAYKNKEIPDNALVIADSRIYRGNIHWGLAGTNYIEAAQFIQIIDSVNQQGSLRNTPVYYIECVIDDCSWGTIKDQPEFNKSMEEITAWFANVSTSKVDITGTDRDKYSFPFLSSKKTEYRVYKANLALNPAIFNAARQTHVWYLYPVGYDRSISAIFDDYETHGFGTVLNGFAWFIHYSELMLSFFAIFYLGYLFMRED